MPNPGMSDDLLWRACALVKEHGSVNRAAIATGMPRETLQKQIERFRERFPGHLPEAAQSANWAAADPPIAREGLPLSEDERKFHEDWRAEDCISELQRIAKIDTAKIITRNYFRVHSDISESTWNRYFGTFQEFKRQAEIVISRHGHRLERDIARHASVDKMRAMNTEKRQWEGRYLRPRGGRWQTAMVICDTHDLHCDPFYRRIVIETAARVQPEKIVLDGDIVDLPEFSKHFQDPRSFDLLRRIKWLHEFLGDLREACLDAEIVYVEGNHEARLLRHLGEQTQAMMVVLADLHGFTVPKLLGLDRFEVNYVARVDLTAWTERDLKAQLRKNYVMLWDGALLFGHFPEMRSMGIPGGSGHHHKHIVWPQYSPSFGPYEWHQIGCGHQREASYCAGEKWGNGFLLAHCDTLTKRTQFEYIDLSHSAAMVGGRHYERTADEPVLDLLRGAA